MIKQSTIIITALIGFTCLNIVPAYAIGSLGVHSLLNSANQMEEQASHAAEKQQLSLQDVIKHADTMITSRITALNSLLTRIQNDTRLTADEKSNFSSSIQTTITGLTSLKAKIDADTDVTTARTDAKEIVTNYYVYEAFEPKTRLLITLNNLQTTTSYLQALIPQLQALVTTLQSQGKDTSQLSSLLNEMNTQIQTVHTTVSQDITTVQNMSTTADPNSTMKQVKQDIQTVDRTGFQKIKTDISQLRSIFTQLILPKRQNSATGSASTTIQTTSSNITITSTP